MEQADQEINLKLQGLGLSLVNNLARKEIAYLSITSSGAIWETRKRKRFKAMKLKQCDVLEFGYNKYLRAAEANPNANGRVTLEGKMEV